MKETLLLIHFRAMFALDIYRNTKVDYLKSTESCTSRFALKKSKKLF